MSASCCVLSREFVAVCPFVPAGCSPRLSCRYLRRMTRMTRGTNLSVCPVSTGVVAACSQNLLRGSQTGPWFRKPFERILPRECIVPCIDLQSCGARAREPSRPGSPTVHTRPGDRPPEYRAWQQIRPERPETTRSYSTWRSGKTSSSTGRLGPWQRRRPTQRPLPCG